MGAWNAALTAGSLLLVGRYQGVGGHGALGHGGGTTARSALYSRSAPTTYVSASTTSLEGQARGRFRFLYTDTDDSPDVICSNGLDGVENVTIGVCCDNDCDVCGDAGCTESVDCCPSTIAANGTLCSATGEAPCIVDDASASTPAPTSAASITSTSTVSPGVQVASTNPPSTPSPFPGTTSSPANVTSSSPAPGDSSATYLGAIIGGVVGGLLLVGAIVFFFLWRRAPSLSLKASHKKAAAAERAPAHEEGSATQSSASVANADLTGEPEPEPLLHDFPKTDLAADGQVDRGDRTTTASALSLTEKEDPFRRKYSPPPIMDAFRLVVDSAQAVAERSSLPLVAEIANFIGVLANLSKDFGDNQEGMPKTVRWCSSMLEILDSSNLREDDVGPVGDLLEEVHEAIAEIVKIVTCFLRRGKLGRILTSTLYKRRQETAEDSLRDALHRLQAGVSFVSVGVLRRTSSSVDYLAASMSEERRISRKDRKKRMLEQQEIAPGDITFFDDMVLGSGGFATVQLAEYQQTTVAAKVVSMAEVDAGEEAKEKVTKMFVCELHAMENLRSDYTVNLFGSVTTIAEKLVLVMEFMEGGDLRAFLNQAEAPLEDHVANGLAHDIAKGMQFLHSRNAIHGDLKSPNVLLTGNNRAKIADFGTVRTKEEITSMATRGGKTWRYGTTLKWAAPEVLNDEGSRFESDVYSYGIVLWEIVSRQIPWNEVNIKELLVKVCRGVRPKVPSDAPPLLESTMQQCWADAPSDRLTFVDVLGIFIDV